MTKDLSESNIEKQSPAAPWGVVLLAHGSQRGSDTYDGLQEMVRLLQECLGNQGAQVQMSCLEFIEPFLPQAVANFTEQGIKQVVVMPFLLGQGTHTTEDLDEETEKSLALSPDADITMTEIFGCDPALVQIVVNRVREHAASLNGFAGSKRGVMLVKAGTRSPNESHQWLYEMGQMVEASLGDGYAVSVAQSHFGSPTMEEATAELIDQRDVSSVICVPYLFFPGLILTRNIIGGLEELGKAYPTVNFSTTPTLGVDDKLVELTTQRILDARARQQNLLASPSIGDD